jgi:hypothetical protein
MDPAQGVLADVELSCVVAQTTASRGKPCTSTLPDRVPLGSDQHGVLDDAAAAVFGSLADPVYLQVSQVFARSAAPAAAVVNHAET